MAKPCEHLARVTQGCPPADSQGACEECLAEGTAWVALPRVPIVRPRRLLRLPGRGSRCEPNTSMRRNIPVMRAVPPCGLDMVRRP